MICPNCGKKNTISKPCGCEPNLKNTKPFKYAKRGVLFTAVGYPFLFMLFTAFLVLVLKFHFITLIISYLYMIVAMILTFISGYYYIIIPIPMIYPINVGFRNENKSEVKKKIYKILIKLCYIIPFALNLFIYVLFSIL